MGKTVLYLGISLDGYLADRQGGVGWLEANQLNTTVSEQYMQPVYHKILSRIRSWIM